MAKLNRITIPGLSEYYLKLLKLDCYLSGRQRGIQIHSLLCAKLQEREERIFKRLDFLAESNKISREELIQQILGLEEDDD